MCRTAIERSSPPSRIARAERAAFAALILSLASIGARPVQAQISGAATFSSDDRWRGRSLSAGRPAASITLGFDAPSGIYADGAVTVAAKPEGPAATGASIDAGYAWRTAQTLVVDIGVTRRQFTRHFSGGRTTSYSEIYAGVAGRSLSTRLAYSPSYFAAGVHTLYGSVDAVQHLGENWRLTAHAGAIVYVSPIRVRHLHTLEYDGDVGIAHRSGPIDIRLDASFGGPNADYYSGSRHSKSVLVASVTASF